MTRAAAVIVALLVAGCAPPPVPVAAPAPAPGPTYASHVVTLAAGTPLSIVAGPFAVTAINPGSDLQLALVTGAACPDDATWFAYSGGGVAVGRGETLCARSSADAPRVHAFSGHD